MNLTCANCGSKLSFTTGKLNFAVEPCRNCIEEIAEAADENGCGIDLEAWFYEEKEER